MFIKPRLIVNFVHDHKSAKCLMLDKTIQLWNSGKNWINKTNDKIKAMKSSPLHGTFDDLKFFGFSLLKIKIGWFL